MLNALDLGSFMSLCTHARTGIIATTLGHMQTAKEIYLYQWTPILWICIFIVAGIFTSKIYRPVAVWFLYVRTTLRDMLTGMKIRKVIVNATPDEIIEAAGYSYDPKQDIFYSKMDAWQRNMGYCRLYDEAAAPLSMIMDCEPIYFEYDNKRWLIEFWKGQYGVTTGCEIGVYATEGPDLNIAGVFNGTFYYCVSDEDRLQMTFSVEKKGKILFVRNGIHWWLTGFMLGEFSEPWELRMHLYITFKNGTMRSAFVKGLMDAGYSRNEIAIDRNTVGIKFDKPHTIQPFTRTKQTDWIVQRNNKILCSKYQEITKEYDNSLDKIKIIQEQAPEVFEKVLNIGKTKEFFNKYEKIKRYLK